MCRRPDFQVHFAHLISRRGSYVLEPLRSCGEDTLWDVSMVAQACDVWISETLAKSDADQYEREQYTGDCGGHTMPGGNGTATA